MRKRLRRLLCKVGIHRYSWALDCEGYHNFCVDCGLWEPLPKQSYLARMWFEDIPKYLLGQLRKTGDIIRGTWPKR